MSFVFLVMSLDATAASLGSRASLVKLSYKESSSLLNH